MMIIGNFLVYEIDYKIYKLHFFAAFHLIGLSWELLGINIFHDCTII